MNTIELTLQRKTDSGYPVIAALTRPGGFLPLRREGTLNLDLPALAELQFEPLAYGTALGQALFVDEIRDTFVKALGDAPLRVLLSVEAPELRAIDWHRLAAPFDGRWRFLAVQQNTPFSLSIPSPASAHFPAIGRRDLRILLLVAGPESLSGDYKLAPFDVPATIAGIQKSLGEIPCDVLDNPSLDVLCTALTATPYTLLHLVCHGAVNQNGETILYFPKDATRTPTPATTLLDRLASLSHLPHFVFISACESALPQNGISSLAGRLVRELGLPAVLAMTDRVSIATVRAIAAPFYAKLYEHGQPDLALAQSLAGLQGAHDLTVPALLSRLGDRPLFDDNAERALTDQELEFGLTKLAEFLPERAPVMDSLRDSLTRRLRSTLGADVHFLSESRRTERKETLDQLNSLSLEALDLSFNALCLGQTPPAYDSRSPFRGLESFRPEDAAYFFGREVLSRKLVQKLKEHNFLAVLGASGSGKSSLVMAGLIPAFNGPYVVFRPGAEPLLELEKALQAGPSLLVVDQFEELFTISVQEQRADFISRLLEQSHRIRVVITLRADFIGDVAPFEPLKDEVQNYQEIIPPMDEVELRRAMEGQAGCAGLRFESDLSQQMLDDVAGEPGAMPLLQHALWTLWMRRHGRWLRAEEYRAFGGVKQAISSTAEAVYARCSEFERERLRDIFLRLTRLDADAGADRRDTRRRVLLRDLIPTGSDPASTTLLVKQLADARLLVVTGDEVEVAHEALIRHWERLRGWLNGDRDNLSLREGVSDDARCWENANRDESLLSHRGPRLELALAMSKDPRYPLNPMEHDYLDGCKVLSEQQKAAAAKRRRLAIISVSAAIIVIMAILVGWGWTSNENSKQLGYQIATATYAQGLAQQQAEIADAAKLTAINETNARATAQALAEEQRNVALARQLAAQAQSILGKQDFQQETGRLLAILSMELFPSVYASQLLQGNLGLTAHPLTRMDHTESVWSVAFSPDTPADTGGKYVVSGSADGTARVWKSIWADLLYSTAPAIEISRMVHDGNVTSVAFSPDGQYVVSGSQDNTARLWEVTTGKEISRMTHSKAVTSVAFSPDGKYVVSGSEDGTARIWEATSGIETVRVTHGDMVTCVTFSPDGKYVASGSRDNTARVWESATGQEIARMLHNDEVWLIVFSSQTNREKGWDIATASLDGTARVWNTVTGKEISRMTHDDRVWSVDFSPDGKYVVSSSDDHTARVWMADTGKEISRMAHNGWVYVATFSPDGKYVVSGSSDLTWQNIESTVNNTASVWEVATGREISRLEHNGWVLSLAFSSDGKYIVSGSKDGAANVWLFRPEDLIANACLRVTRNLTHTEWKQYIGDALPYQSVCPNLPPEAEPTDTPDP